MNFERKVQVRIVLGYIIMLIFGIGMMATLLHERKRVNEVEAEMKGIQQVQRSIHILHRHITELAIQGESVIGWEEKDYYTYRNKRLRTDSLLETIRSKWAKYANREQTDTLRRLLADKEVHLLHIMEAMQRQEAADSLLVNHLPEVARRARASAPSGGRKADLPAHWAESGRCGYCPRPASCMPSATAWWPCSGSVRRKWMHTPTACTRAIGR